MNVVMNFFKKPSLKVLRDKLCQYYFVFVGTTSYVFDANTNKYHQTTLTAFLAPLSNFACLILLSYYCYKSARLYEPYPRLHPLIKAVNRLNLVLRITVTFYTALHRYFRESYEIPIKQQLQEIEWRYFSQIPRPDRSIEKQFRFLSILKSFMSCYLHFMWFLLYSKMSEDPFSVSSCILNIGYTTILNVTYMVLYNFFKILCRICRLLVYLNQQVGKIYDEVQMPGKNLRHSAGEIENILAIHMELSIILKKLLTLYQFQLIITRLVSTTTNIMAAYFGYVFTCYYHIRLSYLAVGAVSYIIVAIDFYLIDLICEMIKESFKNLIENLQKFNEKHVLYEECEKFSFYLCSRKSIFCDSGLDRAAWFKIMTQLLAGTIVLIQSHINIVRIYEKLHLELD